MSTHYCIQCRVFGRVQGVWFRGSTRNEANRLGLSGYARNLPDGSVEVVACGPAVPLAALRQWLQQGPSSARVDQLDCSDLALSSVPAQYRQGFAVE